MAYVAVDENEDEFIYSTEPYRLNHQSFWRREGGERVQLVKGSIEKLIGRKLTWEDEPVELKEQQ